MLTPPAHSSRDRNSAHTKEAPGPCFMLIPLVRNLTRQSGVKRGERGLIIQHELESFFNLTRLFIIPLISSCLTDI